MRLSHRAVAASALAVVLAGGAFAPAVADADDKGGRRGDKGRSEEARSRGAERGSDRAKAARARPAEREQGRRQEARVRPARSQGGAAGQDPAGNNGTVKVDGPPYDAGMDNEPHVACEFRLLFFGFDDDQTGDITIAGHAPSGSGVVSAKDDVLLSDDPAGGGPNDPDAVVQYTLADLDLSGLTAHPQQGYHLKVTVETGEPGGVKHKVFWLEPCVPAVGAGGAVGGGAVGGGAVGGGAGGGGAEVGAVDTEAADRTAVLGTRLSREEAARGRGAEVLGVSLTRRPLAFTGSFTEALLAAGTALLAAGTGLVAVAARKPRGRHAA